MEKITKNKLFKCGKLDETHQQNQPVFTGTNNIKTETGDRYLFIFFLLSFVLCKMKEWWTEEHSFCDFDYHRVKRQKKKLSKTNIQGSDK